MLAYVELSFSVSYVSFHEGSVVCRPDTEGLQHEGTQEAVGLRAGSPGGSGRKQTGLSCPPATEPALDPPCRLLLWCYNGIQFPLIFIACGLLFMFSGSFLVEVILF